MSNDVDALQLHGPVREDALKRAAAQLAEWNLTMPPVDPLVMDFGAGDFENFGLIEYWVANEVEAGYCGKFMFVFDGQRCPTHSHEKKHETFFVMKGKIRLTVNGDPHILGPGAVYPVPTGNVHVFVGVGNALILELSMPSLPKDNKFEEPCAAEWLKRNLY